ncbi:MAG: hypothetical protein HY057_09265, partial [Rhodospirillales bacterium]|nr:hypothetical protein [Rhodospirillales bacterium]
MIVEDQSATVAFLSRPEAYGLRAGEVERIETHGAIVFLAAARAYKLKRAVRFPYMDFSTLDRRRTACADEVRINRRTAPTLYEGTTPIVRGAKGLALGGEGEIVDWLVVMHRFDQAGLFDRLAAGGRLTREMILDLADAIARFHAAAEPQPAFGGIADMIWVVDNNRTGLDAAAGVFAAAD